MREENRNRILNCSVNGIITAKTISVQGMHRGLLREMLNEGDLAQYSRGIYMAAEDWEDEFYFIQQRYKRGIFSHTSALYLLGYSERVPLSFHLTFPINYNSHSLKAENVTVTRVNDHNYALGRTYASTPSGNQVVAYDLERSLCDILRGSGDDIQVIQYAMKKYAYSSQRDLEKLMRYARQLRVEPKVRKYIEVLL